MKRLILIGILGTSLFAKVTGVFTVPAADQIALKALQESVDKAQAALYLAKAELCDKEHSVAAEKTKLSVHVVDCNYTIIGSATAFYATPAIYTYPPTEVEFSEDFQSIIIHKGPDSAFSYSGDISSWPAGTTNGSANKILRYGK